MATTGTGSDMAPTILCHLARAETVANLSRYELGEQTSEDLLDEAVGGMHILPSADAKLGCLSGSVERHPRSLHHNTAQGSSAPRNVGTTRPTLDDIEIQTCSDL